MTLKVPTASITPYDSYSTVRSLVYCWESRVRRITIAKPRNVLAVEDMRLSPAGNLLDPGPVGELKME